MHGTTVKLLILGVLSFSATCLTIIFSQYPPATNESARPGVSEAETQSVSELIALRIVAKNRIAREVIAHRLSLVQAAALFGALDRLPPPALNPPRSVPAATEEERLCRQVVVYVRSLVAERDRAAALARLDAEFKAERDKGDLIHLSDESSLPPVQELLEQARVELADTLRGTHRAVNSPSARPPSAGAAKPRGAMSLNSR
jgi:hypothetical protein